MMNQLPVNQLPVNQLPNNNCVPNNNNVIPRPETHINGNLLLHGDIAIIGEDGTRLTLNSKSNVLNEDRDRYLNSLKSLKSELSIIANNTAKQLEILRYQLDQVIILINKPN